MVSYKENMSEASVLRLDKLARTCQDFFKEEGFKQIYTPNYEPYSHYEAYGQDIRREMTKTVAEDNQVLVLRPDMTIPAARIAAKLEGEVNFSYTTTIFRSYRGLKTQGQDFIQSGIEVFGDDLDQARVISLGVRALKELGIRDLVLNLTDVRVLDEIIGRMGLSKLEEAHLARLVDRRNKEDLSSYLNKLGQKGQALVGALDLFGQAARVLDEARGLLPAYLDSVLDDLEDLVGSIQEAFPGLEVNIDLARVTGQNYYNSSYFEIYSSFYNVVLLSGGRYDDLIENFGRRTQAMGFGINLNIIDEALRHSQSSILRIALAKGRIQKEVIPLLETSGISFKGYSPDSRKLIFESEDGDLGLVLVKTKDVTTYVENGTCDLGIVGSDLLRERPASVYELVSLPIGVCRVSLAAPKGVDLDYQDLTVASKYPKITKDYFAGRGVYPNIVKLNGSVELGPLVGMTDCIVDIVESGGTLRENGLEELDSFMDVSSRVIANKFSLINKAGKIRDFIQAVKGGQDEEDPS